MGASLARTEAGKEAKNKKQFLFFFFLGSLQSLSHIHPVWPSTVVRFVHCTEKFGQGATLGLGELH